MALRGCKRAWFCETGGPLRRMWSSASPAVSPLHGDAEALLDLGWPVNSEKSDGQRHLQRHVRLFKVETARSSITGKMRKRTVSDKANACVNDHFKDVLFLETGNRSSRRESALTLLRIRWSGLTSLLRGSWKEQLLFAHPRPRIPMSSETGEIIRF